jgi:predicted secreted protein
MPRTRSSFLAFVVLLVFTVTATAGDFATLNFIGFSKDGRYLAFEEHGVQDGSGFPYSSIYFIDVEKNAYANAPVTVRIDKETATEAQARARAKLGARQAMIRLKIVQGNTGSLVVARLHTDLTLSDAGVDKKDGKQSVKFAEIIGSMYKQGDYDLVLRSSEVKKTKECEYSDFAIQKLELSLKDNDANKTVVLQKDATVPPSRGCPYEYAIQYVYLYDNRIVVFLNTYNVGFEGRDMRYLAVTGRFK